MRMCKGSEFDTLWNYAYKFKLQTTQIQKRDLFFQGLPTGTIVRCLFLLCGKLFINFQLKKRFVNVLVNNIQSKNSNMPIGIPCSIGVQNSQP